MKSVFAVCIAIIAGVSLGWLAGSYRQGKSTQDAVLLLKQIELNKIETRANMAYASQSPEVAVWELNHMAEVFQEASQLGCQEPKSIKLKLFLAHARLARIYYAENDQEKVEKEFREASSYYNESYPAAKIEDFDTLLNRLDKFDEIGGVQRKLRDGLPHKR